MNRKTILNLIVIIIWLFIIFCFSAEDAEKSQHTSDQVIIKTVETIKQEKLPEEEKKILVNKYIVIVRKSAHFFLYFILGILLFLFWKKIYGITPKTIIYTMIFCFIYACSDEIHQLFINGRTARIFDIFVDSSGALLATSITTILCLLKTKLTKK